MPALVTEVTQQLYDLAEESILKGLIISDYMSAKKAFDGITNTIYSSPNSACYIGYDFKEGMIANIKKIRYLPNPEWRIVGDYLNGGVFEGSNDMSAWETVFSIDANVVHSGWNYWERDAGD